MTTTFTVSGRVADWSAGRELQARVLALLREVGAADVECQLTEASEVP